MIYKVKMRYKVDLDNKKLLSFLYLSFLQQHDHTLYKNFFMPSHLSKMQYLENKLQYQFIKQIHLLLFWFWKNVTSKANFLIYRILFKSRLIMNAFNIQFSTFQIYIHAMNNLVQWIFKLSLSSMSNNCTLLPIVA